PKLTTMPPKIVALNLKLMSAFGSIFSRHQVASARLRLIGGGAASVIVNCGTVASNSSKASSNLSKPFEVTASPLNHASIIAAVVGETISLLFTGCLETRILIEACENQLEYCWTSTLSDLKSSCDKILSGSCSDITYLLFKLRLVRFEQG